MKYRSSLSRFRPLLFSNWRLVSVSPMLDSLGSIYWLSFWILVAVFSAYFVFLLLPILFFSSSSSCKFVGNFFCLFWSVWVSRAAIFGDRCSVPIYGLLNKFLYVEEFLNGWIDSGPPIIGICYDLTDMLSRFWKFLREELCAPPIIGIPEYTYSLTLKLL